MNEKTRTTHYDVGGILLDRPFRILRLGHFGFNVRNQETALCFYSDLLGLPVTDTRDFGGRALSDNVEGKDPNGYFLRIGADHHSVVLFPIGPWRRPLQPSMMVQSGSVTWPGKSRLCARSSKEGSG